MKLEKNFLKVIREAARQKTHAYDTSATVTRVEDGTAWIHIDGGVAETPAELTIAAKAGDKVKARVSGGRAYLLGNSTAPPTDDAAAYVASSLANAAAFNAKTAQQKADETEEKTKNAITSMVTYYKLSAITPLQPTDENYIAQGWSSTEPVWDEDDARDLYFSIRTRTAGGAIEWTAPAVLNSYASLTVAQNAIMSEVSATYLSQSDASNIYATQTALAATNTRITQTASEIRMEVSATYLTQDDAEDTYLSQGDASNTYVSRGSSGISSLGSALVQTANGLDIYSTVNGSTQATHTHIDGDSFDVVKNGVTVASFGEEIILGNSTRYADPQNTKSFIKVTENGFEVKPQSTWWDAGGTAITADEIDIDYGGPPEYFENDYNTFDHFHVGTGHLYYGDPTHPARPAKFEVGTTQYTGEGISVYEYETFIRIGHTILTETDLYKLKQLIS